jgi:hypothetical protein
VSSWLQYCGYGCNLVVCQSHRIVSRKRKWSSMTSNSDDDGSTIRMNELHEQAQIMVLHLTRSTRLAVFVATCLRVGPRRKGLCGEVRLAVGVVRWPTKSNVPSEKFLAWPFWTQVRHIQDRTTTKKYSSGGPIFNQRKSSARSVALVFF